MGPTVSRGSLEVVDYVPRQSPSDATPLDRSRTSEDIWSRLRREHRTLSSCMAALAALALHALLVTSVLWVGGSSGPRQRYGGDTALQWVVLAESVGNSGALGSPVPPKLRSISVTAVLPPLTLSALPQAASDLASAPADGQSGAGDTHGRYLGQIRARIERAWLRPRTAIGAPIFQCQVQVDQDSDGKVQEVTLLECNGGARWQLSLVHAIEAASPLPAPSDPAVFVHHVLLAFRAVAYSPAQSAQLYEPPGALQGNDDTGDRDTESQNAFQALREAAQAPNSRRALQLRIEGSKVEVESDRQ